MPDKRYIQQFASRFWKFWFLSLVIGALVGVYAASQMRPTYQGTVAYTVTVARDDNQPQADFYQYDGFYQDQAAAAEANSLASWLKAPQNVHTILSRAGLSNTVSSVDGLARYFKINDGAQVTGSTVSAVYRTATDDEARKIGGAMIDSVKSEYPVTDATINVSNPVILSVAPAKTLVILASIAALGVLSFVISLIMYYFSTEE